MIDNPDWRCFGNKVGYWMLMCALIESNMVEVLEYKEEKMELGDENAFILFDESAKLLTKYLFKLNRLHNADIFNFYYQILNLFYFYDAPRTYNALVSTFKEFPQHHQIYTKIYILEGEDPIRYLRGGYYTAQMHQYVFLSKGCLWNLLGFYGLLEYEETKQETEAFITSNAKILLMNAEIVASFLFPDKQKELKGFRNEHN
mmetsp:Transcript_36618/g.27129  ORF Transcript_36618/g.27129 Transcript_36618/m.27129 type:complete len:202 (+) Transcript_36618:216-821(+)